MMTRDVRREDGSQRDQNLHYDDDDDDDDDNDDDDDDDDDVGVGLIKDVTERQITKSQQAAAN
ncbi:hypothetical protein E2C01_020673 [Portunus trituberculatus]|uniref:Uncharacterized protein n=1 Tax=Portunus trituberculatus TaxID=210409 RepID=A0A5B7E2Q4_PORTR|nr:hypothetical protein [Portunus trituberculatus]